MSRLFIAEKPSLAKVLANCLGGITLKGNGYFEVKTGDIITWCFGHLYEQANPEDYDPSLKKWGMDALPIVPSVWKLKPRHDAKQQIEVISKLLKSASSVVNAGDPDREGQLLVDEVIEECGYKGKVLRIWLQDLTDAGVQASLSKLQSNDIQLYKGMSHAAISRSRADWLMGMNLTRACTLAGQSAGYNGVLSVGRVQTPTLALVVDRDNKIDNFKAIAFYGVVATWKEGFTSQWKPKEGDDEGRCIDAKIADVIAQKIKGQSATVTKCDRKQVKSSPPLPFSLSELQSEASKRFGMGAQAVLDIAQSLYEKHKITSYPRTDCGYLSSGQHKDGSKILKALSGQYNNIVDKADVGIKSNAFNDKKVTAHTGIIPTGQSIDFAALNKNEQQLFDLIARRYIAQFYPEAVFDEAKIDIAISDEVFVSSGKVLIKQGWRACINAKADENVQELPQVSEGQTLSCLDAKREDKKTTPPARFSEGSLIKAMANIARMVTNVKLKAMLKETSGIGTEATRAGVIETLKSRNFIVVKGKNIISTSAGRDLINALPDNVTSPDMTAFWELQLEQVADGSSSIDEFIGKQVKFVSDLVGDIKSGSHSMSGLATSVPDCPKCKSKLKLITAKQSGKKYWVCSTGRDICDTIYGDKSGKPDFSPKKKTAAKPKKKAKS